MIQIGTFIKLQRTKQNMTLSELADGIVSVSHLSKIENLKTDANDHIIKKLCDKLGIQLREDLEPVIKEKISEWHKLLFNNNDKEKNIAAYQELQTIFDQHLSRSLILFEIYKIRYYLVINKINNAEEQIKQLNKLEDCFNTEEQYYWLKFCGNYNSSIGKEEKAIEHYQKAKSLIRKLDLSENEQADLQYTISIAYSKMRNTVEAINYAEEALGTFMKNYHFLRCAQCHILLGISYRRLKMYDKAIKNYNLAKHLAELDNNRELIQLTNQNIGYLYAAQGKNDEAIEFYTIAENEATSIPEKLSALTELIKVYHEIEECSKAKFKIEEALELLEQDQGDPDYQFNYYVIHTYYYEISNQKDKFSALVKEEFLPFLRKQNDHANYGIFATMLAEYYESIQKYKDAAKYYKLASTSYKELSHI